MLALSERRFTDLRKQLDELGYKHTLGIETVPLVEALLQDLLQERSTSNSAKLEAYTLKQQIKHFQAREDKNSRSEHRSPRKHSPQDDVLLEEYKKSLQKLEHENLQLKFSNTQYQEKIRTLEKESSEKTDKIVELLEKGPKPIIQITGKSSTDNGGAFRREKMEISEMLPKKELSAWAMDKIQRQIKDPFVVDLLHVAETTISKLQAKVNELNLKLEATTRRNSDREIHLKRPETSGTAKEEMLVQLSKKIDALKEQIQELEEKDRQLSERKAAALGNTKHRQTLSPPRNPGSQSKVGENTITKPKLVAQNSNEKKSPDKPDGLDKENLLKDNEELVSLLANKDKELRRLEELANNLKEENELMDDRIKQLKANNTEKSTPRKVDDQGELLPATERLITSLEAQRDHYREEAKALRELLCSHHHYKIPEVQKNFFSSSTQTPTEESSEGVTKGLYASTTAIRLLEEEKDFYKHQYEELLKERLHRKRNSSPSKSPPTHDTSDSETTSNYRLDDEDRLALKREVGKLRTKLNEVKREITAIKSDLDVMIMSASTAPTPERTSRVFVEDGLEIPERDIQPPSSKIDDSEVKKLEIRIRSLQEIVNEMESENSELRSNLESHTTLIKALQSQNKALQTRLSATENELFAEKMAAESLPRAGFEHELLLDQARDVLAGSEELEAQVKQLNGRNVELNQLIAQYQKEILSLKAAVAALDREKNQLQTVSDSKDEQMEGMQQLLNAKEQDLQQTHQTVQALEGELSKVQSELRNKEREVISLNTRINVKMKEIERTNQQRDDLQREVRQLEENLGVLTKDNQNLSKRLEASLQEQDKLKQQIQEYVTEVTRVEELLNLKEQERLQLIEQFQSIAQENSALDSQAHELECRNSNTRLEVLAKESELKYCHSTIATLEHRVQELELMQQNYEQQVVSLNSATATLKTSLQQGQNEIERLQSELTASRDACFQLELSQGNLQQQLSNREMEREKAIRQVEELQEEIAALRASLASEKATVLSLEGILATNREREFCTQVSLQEMSAELRVLKERLQESEEKIRAYSKDIATYKTKVSELQMQADRLKRQLTDERFERERANQELRKLQQRSKGVSVSSMTLDDRNQSRSLTGSPLPQSSTTQTSPSDAPSSTYSRKSTTYSNLFASSSPTPAGGVTGETRSSFSLSHTETKKRDADRRENEDRISSRSIRDSPAGGGKSPRSSNGDASGRSDDSSDNPSISASLGDNLQATKASNGSVK